MLCLLLSVFDIMAGVRAVSYFNNLDGVSKGGRGPLLQDARVDQSNVWAKFGPCRGLHIGGAKGKERKKALHPGDAGSLHQLEELKPGPSPRAGGGTQRQTPQKEITKRQKGDWDRRHQAQTAETGRHKSRGGVLPPKY